MSKSCKLIFFTLVFISLTGCFSNSSSLSSNNAVNVSTPANSYVTAINTSVQVPVTFNASSAILHTLSVNLSSLPPAWSAQNEETSFNCSNVASSGSTCQLNLVFSPTVANRDNGILPLNYSYINFAGKNITGQISLDYAVLNQVMAAANPTPPINTVINSTQNVFISFSALPSATTAKNLQITSDLTQLPSGWSVIGGLTSFSCAAVQGMNGCQLGLSFAPTTTSQSGNLNLNFNYYNNSGVLNQGIINIPYSVTTHNTVQGTITPVNVSAPVNNSSPSSVPVSIAYTTSDGAPATDFQITSGLNGLSSLGWSGPSIFTCHQVTGSNGCILNLNFSPTDYNQDGTLHLAYSYKDNSNSIKTGNTDINYTATTTDTIQTNASPASPINTYVNHSIPVTLTFITNDGQTATNLNMIQGLNSLPAGWSQVSGTAGVFNCSSINIGTGCQLILQFNPTAGNSGTLSLTYSYLDNSGNPKNNSINLDYSATAENNVQFSTSPTAPLTLAANNTQPVTVNFTTDNGTATNLSMDLSNLSNNNPGWSTTNPSLFTCATVNMGQAICTLNLVYAPTTKQSSVLSLAYSYIANDNSAKTGTFTYAYTTGNDSNSVNATSNPVSALGTMIGNSIPVTVTFNTSSINPASNLSIDLSSLPSGWSASTPVFNCATVPAASGGGNCSFNLVYNPTQSIGSTALSIPYTYTSNDGQAGNGNISIPYSATSTYAYITNAFTGSVSQCLMDNNYEFTSCNQLTDSNGTINQPQGIAIQSIGINKYAYISNGGNNNISQCSLDNNGQFTSCISLTDSNGSINDPHGLIVESMGSNKYIYITNRGNRSVSQCLLDNNGQFTSCTKLTDNNDTLVGPDGIAIQTIGANNYAYISNFFNSAVSQCLLNSNGQFNSCTALNDTNHSLTYSTAINTQTIGSNVYAYVTNAGNSSVSQCLLDSNGQFTSCMQLTDSNQSIDQPFGIAIQTIGDHRNIYITNLNHSNVSQCALDNSGQFTSCGVLSDSNHTISGPEGIVLSTL